jgi:hypothetical protein
VQQRVHGVQGGPVLLHRVGGQQLRADGLLEVLQGAPDAYSYPKDDATSIYTCPGGTNYQVIFCP